LPAPRASAQSVRANVRAAARLRAIARGTGVAAAHGDGTQE